MTTTTELYQDAIQLIDSAMFTFGLGLITEAEYYAQLDHAKELIDAVSYVDEHHGVYKAARRYYDKVMVPDPPRFTCDPNKFFAEHGRYPCVMVPTVAETETDTSLGRAAHRQEEEEN